MKQDEIKFVGLHDVEDPLLQETVHKLAAEYFGKIKRSLDDLVSMNVHVKVHGEGKRKKYSIHMKVLSPAGSFISNKAHDWDIARTMHRAGTECLAQIQHTLHTDDQRPKRVLAQRERNRL